MTSTMVDRLDGLSSSTAVKGPCRVATTANITLSGTQTIDGVAVVADDRVLVKDQDDAAENGIYVVGTPWRRARDFLRTTDVRRGTRIWVTDGDNGPAEYEVKSANPIAIGEDDIDIEVSAGFAGTDLPPLTANTMLVDNAGGTAREAKTFAQVRSLLEAIDFAELGVVEAWNNGVPGDGTDQTTALQALIDDLPAEGGTVMLKGDVQFTTLDLSERRNILLTGAGGMGSGATQRSQLKSTAGAIGTSAAAINCRETVNVSFEKLYILNLQSAFNGSLIDYGKVGAMTPGEDSSLMTLRDLTISILGASALGLQLHGATQGKFADINFGGVGYLVSLQRVAGVGFCNVHTFEHCRFGPAGSKPAILGSGEGITLLGCNFQASSDDGKGRAWDTDLTQPFKGVSVIGCTAYDATATGEIWFHFYTGAGFVFKGNRMGGVGNLTGGNNYGVQIGGGADGTVSDPLGVSGFDISNNVAEYMTAFVNFGGTAANYDNCRNGKVEFNWVKGTLTNPSGHTNLCTSAAQTSAVSVGPNEIHNGATDFGAVLNWRYLVPTASTGLVTGDLWRDSGAVKTIT